jgi:predicted transcriptional regulator
MKMQQLIRGMEGRNRMMCLYKMQQDLTAASLREHHAANIQRIFRAWYSRKYRYSHSRRKMYIEYVVKQGEQVLGMMQEYASLQQEVVVIILVCLV